MKKKEKKLPVCECCGKEAKIGGNWPFYDKKENKFYCGCLEKEIANGNDNLSKLQK